MVRLLDVANVVGHEVQMGQVQGMLLAAFNIDHVSVIDYEAIDLERISLLQSVLPSAIPQRSRILALRRELRPVEVKGRADQAHVGDHACKQQLFPLNPETHNRKY